MLKQVSGLDFWAKTLPGAQPAVILYGISYKQEETTGISTLCFIHKFQLLRKKQPIITHTHTKKIYNQRRLGKGEETRNIADPDTAGYQKH